VTTKKTDSTVNNQVVDQAAQTEPTPKPEIAVPTIKTMVATDEAPKTAEAPVEKDTDLVKLKVTVGTLGFEGGIFQRGETFTVTRARAKLFDPRDVTPTI
jgi:hypothetical protein